MLEVVANGGGARQFSLRNAGHRWPELLALLVFLECCAASWLATRYHIGPIPWSIYYLVWLVPAGAIYLGVFVWWLARNYWHGRDRPIEQIFSILRSVKSRPFLETVVPIAVVPAFMASCTTFKVAIGHLTSFGADELLSRVDGIFGFQPWQLTHALIGPTGTYALDRAYVSWFLVNQVMLLAVLFAPAFSRHRAQVIVTFVGVWIVVGGILALAIPSVGPCYYGHLHPIDPYAPLMAQLHGIDQTYHLTSASIQQGLWTNHIRGGLELGSGISAMPSMHVALATITGLLLGRMGFVRLGWSWVALIWIGSIHLGWHYASDGIVGTFVTLLIWKGVARLLSHDAGLQGQSTRPARLVRRVTEFAA